MINLKIAQFNSGKTISKRFYSNKYVIGGKLLTAISANGFFFLRDIKKDGTLGKQHRIKTRCLKGCSIKIYDKNFDFKKAS